MYRCNHAGQFLYVNAALVRLLGYDSADEVLALTSGRDVYVDPDERARLLERYRPDGGFDGARVRWKTKQGRELTVQIHGHVVEDPTGPSFDVSVLDITELETANRELHRQREALATTAAMLDQVVRQMPALYWIADRDLRICTIGGAMWWITPFTPLQSSRPSVSSGSASASHLASPAL